MTQKNRKFTCTMDSQQGTSAAQAGPNGCCSTNVENSTTRRQILFLKSDQIQQFLGQVSWQVHRFGTIRRTLRDRRSAMAMLARTRCRSHTGLVAALSQGQVQIVRQAQRFRKACLRAFTRSGTDFVASASLLQMQASCFHWVSGSN